MEAVIFEKTSETSSVDSTLFREILLSQNGLL